MRSAVKQLAETILTDMGPAALARRSLRSRAVVFAYHNIVPDGTPGAGDRSLHLSRSAFAAQLDHLKRHFDVVPLGRLLDAPPTGRPRAAITFDDAYEGAVTIGTTELAQRGMPSTIFVVPSFLGGRGFWWDLVADPSVRDRYLYELGGEHERVRAARPDLPETCAPAHRTATADQLHAVVSGGLVTLGSHTWTHPNLEVLDPSRYEAELARPLAWLTGEFGAAVIPWIAYPYGLSNAAAREAARASGYRGGLLAGGGPWPARISDPFTLPRVTIPSGVSLRGFALRAAGLRD